MPYYKCFLLNFPSFGFGPHLNNLVVITSWFLDIPDCLIAFPKRIYAAPLPYI